LAVAILLERCLRRKWRRTNADIDIVVDLGDQKEVGHVWELKSIAMLILK